MMRPTIKTLEFEKSNMAAAAILKKSKNRHISSVVAAISTKFNTVTQFDLLDCSECKINLVEKLQKMFLKTSRFIATFKAHN